MTIRGVEDTRDGWDIAASLTRLSLRELSKIRFPDLGAEDKKAKN